MYTLLRIWMSFSAAWAVTWTLVVLGRRQGFPKQAVALIALPLMPAVVIVLATLDWAQTIGDDVWQVLVTIFKVLAMTLTGKKVGK